MKFKKQFRLVLLVFLCGFGMITLRFTQAKTLHDPTRPPVTQISTTQQNKNNTLQWQLSAILISAERRIATINGIIVRQGELIQGAKVLDIQAVTVTLKKQNKDIRLYLFPPANIKTLTSGFYDE